MLLIPCPHCGPRNESEFQHGGPTRRMRPGEADGLDHVPGQLSDGILDRGVDSLDDAQWVDYLTVPINPMGPVDEKWWHVRGCGAWLTLRRDTVTHQILGVARHGA